MTTRFFGPIEIPEDVIPHLAKKEHWKKGYSAYELAYSWVTAGGIPESVSYVLRQADEFRDMKLIQGLFEKKTKLRDLGRTASQTDLLALIGNNEDFAVIGVEGKVDEPFVSGAGEAPGFQLDGGMKLQGRSSSMRLLGWPAAIFSSVSLSQA